MLQGSRVEAVGQTLAHCARLEEAKVSGLEPLAVFVRRDHFVELVSYPGLITVAGADAGEICERFLGVVGILFEDPTRAESLNVSWVVRELRQQRTVHLPLRVPERDHDEQEPDRDLDEVGNSPGHVIRRLVEAHAVACPEGNESAELVAELRYCADEAAAEQPWRALCHVQVCSDVDAAEAQSCDETSEDQDAECVGDRLNDAVWC